MSQKVGGRYVIGVANPFRSTETDFKGSEVLQSNAQSKGVSA